MREYLKNLRKSRKTSQKTVGIAIGYQESYYNMIENGVRQKNMTYTMMAKLAAAFKVPVQTIIDAETEYQACQRNSA